MRFANKIVLVTGAAGGLGAVAATLLAAEGAQVIAADVIDDEGLQVVEAIRETGGSAVFEHLDVTVEQDWDALIGGKVTERFGRLDVLVNNAGVSGAVPDPLSTDAWDTLMSVNARGAFLGMKHAIPLLQDKGGAIVNVSSIAAFGGMQGVHMGYQASKAALHLMTKSAAVQYGRYGIRVNSVHPGMMPPMRGTRRLGTNNAGRDLVLAGVPLGREAQLPEVARAILFLASDEASYITGASLAVDGGWTASA